LTKDAAYIDVFPRGVIHPVLRVDHQRWNQTEADLRHLAVSSSHARSRERFLALHDIAKALVPARWRNAQAAIHRP
jgi:hypothetical protein